MEWMEGGCHCGDVRFKVGVTHLKALDCNCSICTMKGFLHLIVPADRFQLLSDQEALALYTFNTGTAKHYFCGRCGISSFYVPRSHPDGFDVNVRCLDNLDLKSWQITPFAGNSWEENIDSIKGFQ